MMKLLARLVGGAVAPIVDRLAAVGASLARKLALLLVTTLCFLVALVALTIAFDLWVASLAGPIVGALAVAGVYLAIGATTAILALRPTVAKRVEAGERSAASTAADQRGAQIDRFIAPLLNTLRNLGLRREQMAVLAGASVAKQLRPVALVGLAIVAGFVFGRLWKGWTALLSTDLFATLLGLFAGARERMGSTTSQDQPT